MRRTKKQIEKSLYDKAYRKKNRNRLKLEKHLYFQRAYDPIEAAKKRKKMMPKHILYCRQPKYRKWKKGYDQVFLNRKKYGEFWECGILIHKIKKEVCMLVPDKYERLKMRGYIRRAIMKRSLKRAVLFGWKFNYSEMT
jgi:hypothetical protein